MKKKRKKKIPPNSEAPAVERQQPPEEAPKKQPFLKRLLFGEERPDLMELEAGSTTILDILSPTTVNTKSRDYIVVDGVFHKNVSFVNSPSWSAAPTTKPAACWPWPTAARCPGRSWSRPWNRPPVSLKRRLWRSGSSVSGTRRAAFPLGESPAPPLEMPTGHVNLAGCGWVHIQLDTLLPHCRYESPAWLTDTIRYMLTQYMTVTSFPLRFKRMLLVIDEHSSIPGRHSNTDDPVIFLQNKIQFCCTFAFPVVQVISL